MRRKEKMRLKMRLKLKLAAVGTQGRPGDCFVVTPGGEATYEHRPLVFRISNPT